MPKKKNVPMRMCIACREMKPKQEMTRVVRNADGEISADPTGKAPGRGAYICKNEECLNKVMKSNRLEKVLDVKINQDLYESLRGVIIDQ